METITCTNAALAAAFTEWERRYREEPERFMAESERLLTHTPETYGETCASYFLQLLREAGSAVSAAARQYRVMDLSYSQDPRQHLKDVAAYHELDGWRLLTVVHLPESGRWLYYLEREAEGAAVEARASGGEQSLAGAVRRVEVGGAGDVVTAGAEVAAEGVSVEVRRWPAPGRARVLPELSGVRVTRDLDLSLVSGATSLHQQRGARKVSVYAGAARFSRFFRGGLRG